MPPADLEVQGASGNASRIPPLDVSELMYKYVTLANARTPICSGREAEAADISKSLIVMMSRDVATLHLSLYSLNCERRCIS